MPRRSHRLPYAQQRPLSITIASLCAVILPLALLAHAQDGVCSAADGATCSNRQQEVQPPFWHSYTIDDFFQYFQCTVHLPGYDAFFNADDDTIAATPPPPSPRTLQERILTPEQTSAAMNQIQKLRIKYKTEINTVPIASVEDATTVFQVPVMIGDAGVKGRGIYAVQDIPQGTLVLDIDGENSRRNVGVFKDAMQWKEFVYTLGMEDEELACNFMEWCWVQRVETGHDDDNGDDAQHDGNDIRVGHTVFLAFDESGFINNAEWGNEVANIRCGSLLSSPVVGQQDSDGTSGEQEEWSPCKYQYYASRDIKAGDELLINYSEFEDATQTGWIDFGVGIGITIGDETSSSSSR